PAFHHFKQNIVIVHFAGHTKPWLQKRFSDGSVYNGSLNSDTLDMHALWWQTYDDLIKTWKSEDQQAKLQGANFSGNTNSQQGRLHFEVGVPKTADRSSQSFYANESPARYSWNHEELPVLINRQQQSQKRTPVEKAAQKIETLNLKSSSSSLKSSPTRSAGSPMKIFQAVTATQTVTPFQDPHMNLRSASALHILPSTEVASKNSTPPPPPLTTSAAAVQAEYAASAAPTSPTSPTTSVYSVATTIPTSPFAERPNGRSGSTDTQREPSLSPSTSPSRYEWNQAEFSTQQRRKSRLNQPVMIPPVLLGTTGGAGKQFVLNDKNESNVSLYDEEGISLLPNEMYQKKVALGHTQLSASRELQFDQRLFNQLFGTSSGFGTEDLYNPYDKPLFSAGSSVTAIYRPKKTLDEHQDAIPVVHTDRIERIVDGASMSREPHKGFQGTVGGRGCDGPV
ncbi:SNW domain-containing protein 1, partial [Physocladia obscura]